MEEKKVLVFARFDVLLKANGMVVDKGEVYVELNKEQYDRLKASYDTGEFKLLNEDISLLDIYKVFCKEADCMDNLVLLMEYPAEIVENWTFEDLLNAYEHPIPIDVIQKLYEDCFKELDAELDAIADAVNAEVEARCEAEDDEGDSWYGNPDNR